MRTLSNFPLCLKIVRIKTMFPFLNDSHLGGKSSTIHSFNQPSALGGSHPNDDNSISICHDERPSKSCDLLVSHEYFNLDLEFASVKEDVPIETSPSPHVPLCPTIQNTSTCNKDTPCSLSYSSNELSPRLTQGSEVVHDEFENSQIAENSSHPSSYLLLHEDNSPNQLSHEISPIHLSLNALSKEPLQSSNLIVVEAEKFGGTCDKDGCHPESSFEIRNNFQPQTMNDLV